MDELLKAIGMFQQGVQQAATTNAVNDAAKYMQEINMNITDEAQKRVAQQDLANQLSMKLIGTGASAAHIQQAFNAVNPQQFGSVEQMQLEGALSGNKQYQTQANKILAERERKAKDLKKWESDLEIEKERVKGQLAYDRELLKQKQKNKNLVAGYEFNPNAQPTEKDLEELKKASAAYTAIMRDLNELDQLVEEEGTAIWPSATKDRQQKLKTSISLILKDRAGLGALAGPDVDILKELNVDPAAWKSSTYKAQSEELKGILNRGIQTASTTRGAKFHGRDLNLPAGPIKVVNMNGTKIQVRDKIQGGKEVFNPITQTWVDVK